MSASIKCLVVGLTRARLAESSDLLVEAASTRFSDLSHEFPRLAAVELVVTPLFSEDFDALELIDLVAENGYRGTVRIVSPILPNRAAVLRELRAHALRRGIMVEMVDEQ